MYTAADAIAKLDTLGSPRQIADHLVARGCTGWPSEKDRCPVARFVAIETFNPVAVAAEEWWPDTPGLPDHDALPLNVAEFVSYFDHGAFPELFSPDYEEEVRRERWEDAQRAGIPEDLFEAWSNGDLR